LGHPLSVPADIDMVTLLTWNLSQTDLEKQLNDDALDQQSVAALAMIYTNKTKTSGSVFDFTSFGTMIDKDVLLTYLDPSVHDPAKTAYTVMAVTGTVAGKGTRMMRSFRLDPTSTNTKVTLDSESTHLQYTADLHSLQPTLVPANTPKINIDWTDMKTNAMGHPFETTKITKVVLGRYSLSPAELETKFLDLELVAEDMWRGDVLSGTSVSLSTLVDSAGQPFPGIDDQKTWIVALECESCQNPAPWYLSVLKPCK
jgi:hypothetical protein